MPDNSLEQTLLDRTSVNKGNADIAALQQASQAQQQGGSQGLIQHLIAMLRGQPQQPPAAPMSATEIQHTPDVNLPDEGLINDVTKDPRWAELADRKRYMGMRQYPPAMLGK